MVKVVMPRIDEISSEGMVRKWLKREGENVEEGEVIAEVESVKIESELEASSSGVLSKILVEEGVTVPVGEVIAIIAESGKERRNEV